MIGSLSYEEIIDLSNKLGSSSSNIREVIKNYNSDKLNKINDFCDKIESYQRFLINSVELYQDSDKALKYMIEKNK